MHIYVSTCLYNVEPSFFKGDVGVESSSLFLDVIIIHVFSFICYMKYLLYKFATHQKNILQILQGQ